MVGRYGLQGIVRQGHDCSRVEWCAGRKPRGTRRPAVVAPRSGTLQVVSNLHVSGIARIRGKHSGVTGSWKQPPSLVAALPLGALFSGYGEVFSPLPY